MPRRPSGDTAIVDPDMSYAEAQEMVATRALDDEAAARLEGTTPPEGTEEQPPAETEPEEPPVGDLVIDATCGNVTGRPSSTESGTRGTVKFEVHPEDAATLLRRIGKQAFDMTFGKAYLGDGYTIKGMTGRPDADGAARAFVTFNAPETAVANLGTLFKRHLIGAKGKLVLNSSQTTLDGALTNRAED